MIKLLYVRGISAYDTPNFNSLLEQYSFFNSIDGIEIDAYYPPHYTNTIKFSRDEVDNISKYNYLILEFNDKKYFYFIDRITYINEDDYELVIVMDSIQTYMFDITFNQSLVSRKSIKRWNGSKINRDYIRENLSQTSKKLKTYINIEQEGFYLLQTGYNFTEDINNLPMYTTNNDVRNSNGCYYFLIPIPKYHTTQLKVTIRYTGHVDTTFDITQGQLEYTLRKLVDNPYTLNIYYVNTLQFKYLYNVTHTLVTPEGLPSYEQIIITGSDDFKFSTYSCVAKINNANICAFSLNNVKLDFVRYSAIQSNPSIKVYASNNALHKNTSTGVTFDISMIPQLIDENYVELSFGERMCVTRYPLHYAETNQFDVYGNYDIYSGFRNYKIEEYGKTSDEYLTTTVSSTSETLDLYTDAWKTYQAQHKGDLTIGIANAYAKNIYSGVKTMAGGVSTNNNRLLTFDESGMEQKSIGAYRVGTNRMRFVEGATDTIVANASVQAELIQLQENMESTPDTTRCGNEYYNDFISKSLNNIMTVLVSEDIEAVGRKLEYHGYKVMEYTSDNLFTYSKIRYYYNVIKVDNVLLDLNILTTNDIVYDLKNRFTNGLRLWDMSHNQYITEGLKYDNVELEVL